jgi:cyclic pyranopterin phosphate synthase
MVDVTPKDATHRRAVARARVHMQPDTTTLVAKGAVTKGDVLSVARVAGIQAAKLTPTLVPLAHPLPLDHVAVEVTPDPALPGLRVAAEVVVTARTGAEMEALCAVAGALLSLYDMAKALDRGMAIEAVRLDHKSGGRSGTFERPA